MSNDFIISDDIYLILLKYFDGDIININKKIITGLKKGKFNKKEIKPINTKIIKTFKKILILSEENPQEYANIHWIYPDWRDNEKIKKEKLREGFPEDYSSEEELQEPKEEGPYIIEEQTYESIIPQRKAFIQWVNDVFYNELIEQYKNNPVTGTPNDELTDIKIYQYFVMKYLSIETPFRGLLVYHGLGTGKTATSVADLDAPDATQFKQTDAEAASRAGITDPERVEAAAKRQNAADFIESIAAQSADPSASATVAGQLSNLLGDFDVSNPPSWAAGAMRAATAEMVRRGMGASSIAGQAIVQAAMESALPIAQADASIFAQFEGQSLSNKQQMAVIYAQQRAAFAGQEFDQAFQSRVTNAARIADIADKNFTAEQQVVLENSRAANTLNMQNLTNSQALVLAEATSLSQLDVANLNNRQQAAVQEAQAFLQKDMAELSNDQQTTLFKAQQRIQTILSDTAADNARLQFNASSQNQSDQFFANLSTQTSQFNASQKNAIAQFNAGQENTIDRFNAEIGNQRDQFNAQNRLVIDQANAVWRRSIATADTEAVNRANELNASALLDITETAYNDLWQQYADVIEFAYDAAEGELDRATELAIANIDAETRKAIEKERSSTAAGNAIGNLIGTLGSAVIGKVL